MSNMTATYSPEDNKLRLYTVARLDSETYARVKAEGFKWAPKQELFVAPMWTPSRADLLIELCGEIGDEDTALVDRAEERAERFEDYSEKRADDAEAARTAVDRITSGIPMGQPILVGHHSEKHARKDAERIENGMRKAVKMWETSKYWTDRAKGALRHAKYKERPDVRHRRIKGLEADKRKQEKQITLAGAFIKMWDKEGLTLEQAIGIANYDPIRLAPSPERPYGDSLWDALKSERMTVADAAALAVRRHNAMTEHHARWLAHIDNRLAYERAMLGEVGGIAADRFPIEVGGRIRSSDWRARKGWLVVMRVNRADGRINSVSTTEGTISAEDITEYRAPEPGDTAKVKAATKLPPIVNYPGEGFRHMTKAEFDDRKKHSDFYCVRRVPASAKWGAHRRREAPKEGGPYYDLKGVYLTDAKRVDPPPLTTAPEDPVFEHIDAPAPEPRPARVAPERTAFDDMRDQLKHGVQVVSAPQLFPTPPELAARMVAIVGINAHHSVLEPSAGTGNILREIVKAGPRDVVAIEIHHSLADALGEQFPGVNVRCHDFLSGTMYGRFDRIVMNPPFTNGQDVEHVTQAFDWLDDGGILVAVMSAGTKFRSDKYTVAFRALVAAHGEMEDLPEDTFKKQGTGVRTVLVTLRK